MGKRFSVLTLKLFLKKLRPLQMHLAAGEAVAYPDVYTVKFECLAE